MLVLMEFQAEGFCDDLAGEVIAGGTETAGNDDGVGANHHFLESLTDRIAVRHGGLPGDAQPHREKLATEPAAMGIEGVTEE